MRWSDSLEPPGAPAQAGPASGGQSCPDSAALLSDTIPTDAWTDAEVVALVGRAERAVRAQVAIGLRATAELARRRPAPSGNPEEEGLSAYALDELSVACGIARGAMVSRLSEAVDLTSRLPRLLDALQAGLVSPAAVRKVLELTAVLTVERAGQVEGQLLDRLGRRAGPGLAGLGSLGLLAMLALPDDEVISVSLCATTTMVGRLTRDLVRRIDPTAAERREAEARARRAVHHDSAADGTGWLSINGPEALTAAAFERIDTLAREIPVDPDDPRGIDARRADVALDLLFGTPDHQPGQAIRPGPADHEPIQRDATHEVPATPRSWGTSPVNLHVLVDHTRCVDGGRGCVGESGRLSQVTAETLADLLHLAERTGGRVSGAHAVWHRCPGAEAHADLGPGPYEPPEPLKRVVRAHWRRCCFPGCARAARACHLDHTLRYPEGPSCSCNLAPLCGHHHRLKHDLPKDRRGWRLTNYGGRRLTWVTPTGRHLEVWPDPPDPPDPPDRHNSRVAEAPPF